jgi:hypothetical protein
VKQDLEDLLEDWAESGVLDEAEWSDDASGDRRDVMREALHDEYADADADEMSDALDAVLDGMSAAEAFSFSKALRQIGRGATQALANPLVGQIAQAALPVGTGALGTLIGGPAGTALGSRLGTLAASALAQPGSRPAATGAPVAGGGVPTGLSAQPGAIPGAANLIAGPSTPTAGSQSAVAGGSAAAAQGLVLTQQPDVLRALLALAMGQHGQRQVGGVPVAGVMNMLSSVFGQAAADADELAYLDGELLAGDTFGDVGDSGADAYPAVDFGSGRSLYTTWIDAENEELAS